MSRGKVYADPDPQDTDPGASSTAAPDTPLDWLQGDPKLVAEAITEQWLEQSKLANVQQAEARWQANELRRDGYTGVKVIKTNKDQSRYQVWVPMGGKANAELCAESRRLCRAFVGNMMADPPAHQVFPVDTGEDDRDTSDVSERAISDLQSERRLNTPGKVRDSLDTACTYGSGYIVYTVDPTAGGRTVRTMQASPLSPSPQAPLTDPQSGQPYSEPPQLIPDPVTPGALVPGPQAPPPDPVERMVHQDEKQFTDEPQQAKYDWQKDLRSEVLSGRHVRLLPHTIENVWEAHGVMVATFQPWKRLKGMAPELANLPEDEIKTLQDFKPQGSDKLLNGGNRKTTPDNALVFTVVCCYEECADYPDGFYGIAVGGKQMLWRQPWVSFASGKREALLLPVSQCKLFRNGKVDYNGDSLMDDLGGISEVMAAQIGHALAYLDWFNNPQVFVPMHSTIQDSDILSRKPIVRVLPGGEPKSLDPPVYPPMSMTIYEAMREAAKEAAHLPQTAQGMEDPSVKSGRHAYQIMTLAHAQLSEPNQNVQRCYVRCCEIELQYARAFQLQGDAKWTGDDGDYKIQRWQGADLAGDIRLKPGTMTMLSPAAKAQLAEQWMMTGIIGADEGKEMLANGIGATMGMRDEPAKQEVRRQLKMWEDGPPMGWMPPPPMMPGMPQPGGPPAQGGIPPQAPPPQQPPAPPEQASPMGPPMMPPDPALELIWQPRAHHQLPGIAQIRVTELARFMSTKKFSMQPREWQSVAEQELERCMMLAAPPMPAPQVDEKGNPVAPNDQAAGSPQPGTGPLDNPANKKAA